MNTLSNIIPSPLNINKTLNSDYSTIRFATSDFNGKSNTEVINKYKDNTTPNKIANGFYLGGIGEVGLIMQNIDYINNIIKEYGGTEISLNGKYVSSTFYNDENISNKEYSLGNINNVWYYDVSYGMISYGGLDEPYQSIPLYQYSVKDFDSTEDDYDEYDLQDLYTGSAESNTNSVRFDPLSYIYYCQNDLLDNLTNTLSYSFYNTDNERTEIYYEQYSISSTIVLEVYDSERKKNLNEAWSDSNPMITYKSARYSDYVEASDDPENVYVKSKSSNEYYKCEIRNNSTVDIDDDPNNPKYPHFYVYFTKGTNKYCIFSDDQTVLYKQCDISLGGEESIQFSDLPLDLIDCSIQNGKITDVYASIRQKRTVRIKNANCIPLDDTYLFKYPIYSKVYNSKTVYSFPLLPSYKIDNYYDCEFYVFIPEFSKYNTNTGKKITSYNINTIYKNIKVSIKFGDGEIKEVLEPFIKLNDIVIYKFRKQWLYDYMFITNQEIVISIIDSGASDDNNQVLYSKKMFFNIYKLIVQQGKYQNIDFRFKYNNYFPLKYPLPSKKKFLQLNYVPFEKVSDFSYDELIAINGNSESNETISSNQINPVINDIPVYYNETETETTNRITRSKINEYKINFLDLTNNYSYLETNIYHNYHEGKLISDWFLGENGNGLRIGDKATTIDDIQNSKSRFTFNIVNNNENIKNTNCYCLTFKNYDENGILDSSTSSIYKINHTTEYNSYSNTYINTFNNMGLYGVKQFIYIPYTYNDEYRINDIKSIWNSSSVYFENSSNSNNYTFFEDYLFIYNSSNDEVKIYFTDESLTLCENTRMIILKPKEIKLYKPSKHDDYNIIIKNCFLYEYKLLLYQIYKDYDSKGYFEYSSKVNMIINDIEIIKAKMNNSERTDVNEFFHDHVLLNAHNTDNPEIIKVPIYDYTIPLFGNVVIIQKL